MGRSFKESLEAKTLEVVIENLPLNILLATMVFFQHTVSVFENAKVSYFQRQDKKVYRTRETTYISDNIRRRDITCAKTKLFLQ